MIKAMIFDYGGVIQRTVDPRPRWALDRQFNLPRGGAGRMVFASEQWAEAQLGHIPSEAMWQDLGQQLGLSAAGLADFRQTFWAGDQTDAELINLIRGLRRDGYQIALLSNALDTLPQLLVQQGIDGVFDVVVSSAEERVAKPDEAIYRRTLERLDVAAEEAVFIDDSQVNVAAAQRAGLHAVRFRGLARLHQQLRALGIALPEPQITPIEGLRAVIFDWGGVIERVVGDEQVATWERRLALAPGTLAETLWGKLWEELEVNAISEETYRQRVTEQLGLSDTKTTELFLEELYSDNRLNREVVQITQALRQRYEVAVLSNAWPGQHAHVLETFGINLRVDFDVYINSSDVKLRKPDPAIFELALERLDVAPQEALFIDDDHRNVDAARVAGLHAMQFISTAASLNRLQVLLDTHSQGEENS